MGCSTVVISKAMGAAAQSGVPEAQKVVFKSGRNMIVVADIPDVVELLEPEKLIFITRSEHNTPAIDFNDILKLVKGQKSVILMFPGSEPGFSLREIEYGEAYSLPFVERPGLSPIAMLAICLFELKRLQILD